MQAYSGAERNLIHSFQRDNSNSCQIQQFIYIKLPSSVTSPRTVQLVRS